MNGKVRVDLDSDVQEAQPGIRLHIPAGLKHIIKMTIPVVMVFLK